MVEKVEVVVETVGVEGGLTDADMAAAIAAKGSVGSPPAAQETKKRARDSAPQPHAHPDAARASKRERKVRTHA